ncbi:MAG TPA: glycosyltransferase family 39 protein [Verrucomicrobiae bacterium]|nr:glycosyltransferase family 39 protein [Verrucomicrobiae bacterium]
MAASTWRFSRDRLNEIRQWFVRRPYWTLTLVVLAALVPFLAKPFNMDEPLFLWTARQIQAHPGNPYGFNVNWYGTAMPMAVVTKNPPLACYYLALAAKIFGWSEAGLHAAFLLPALAAIWGTYRLARRLCRWPLLAALATLFTPVFLISATTVMCDVMMLAFWVWAVVLWLEGMEENHCWKLTAAGLLIGLAALTKYYGACLVPLLAVSTLIDKRRPGWWILRLLIPLAMLIVYQLATVLLYGHPLFASATGYALSVKAQYGFSRIATVLTGLTFTGGCLAVASFFVPLFWRTRLLAVFAAVVGLGAFAALICRSATQKIDWLPDVTGPFMEAQIIFWAIGGAWVLALTLAEVWTRRDALSCLLGLWVFGTVLFAVLFNWIANGRSLLPVAPALGILLVRQLERKVLADRETWARGVSICLAAAGPLALLAARADFQLASAVRQSARQVWAEYGHTTRTLWFEGHWGFQYYLDAAGASALDSEHAVAQPGDHLAIPHNNSNLFDPDRFSTNPQKLTLRESLTFPGPSLLATWNETMGAGFYASVWGPLPFVFGRVPPESVSVYDFGPQTQAPSQESH